MMMNVLEMKNSANSLISEYFPYINYIIVGTNPEKDTRLYLEIKVQFHIIQLYVL